MKALSVRQPWAELIRTGIKTLEIRSRHTHYRGELLICASSTPPARIFCPATGTLVKQRMLEEGRIVDFPRGVARCRVRLVNSRPMRPDDVAAAGGIPFDPTLFAWELEGAAPTDPFPVKGQLNFFNVEMPKEQLCH